MNKFVAVVGMCGSGKSVVADEFVKRGYYFFRFGQITLDIIKKQGLEPNEEIQKKVREDIRKHYGMGGFALLNLPIIEELLQRGNVVGDGLYSWSEYKILKEKFPDLKIITVYAPPELRWERLSRRIPDSKDTNLRNHHFTLEEAKSRDIAEIENIEKGGPIAMADFLINNTSTIDDLRKKANQIIDVIENKIEVYKRPTWDEYFLGLMHEVGKRGTCDRGRVGCVIAKDKRILSTGYAGSPIGIKHCDEIGHQMKQTIHEDGHISQHCVRTAHAEMNAICNAARHGVSIDGSTLYCKMEPCYACAKAIINAGIIRVVAENQYHAANDSRELFRDAGIKLEVINNELEKYSNQ